MKTLTLTLLLLWLCLSGGMAGWNSAPLLVANIVLWGLLMLWLLHTFPQVKIDLVAVGLLLYVVATLYSGALAGGPARKPALIQAAIWFAYLGFYYLGRQWREKQIHRAARWALLLYGLPAFWEWDNPNVVAFHLVGLALLASPHFHLLLYGPLLLALGLLLHSVGGVLAAVLGATRCVSKPAAIYASLLPLAAFGWLLNPAGYAWRVQFWQDAWAAFLSAPLYGVGPGGYDRLTGWQHAHNIIATTAAESGLIGLAALAVLLVAIARRWDALPTWAAALVLAYGAWSLVDEPLRFFGVGFMFFVALGRGWPCASQGNREGCPYPQ